MPYFRTTLISAFRYDISVTQLNFLVSIPKSRRDGISTPVFYKKGKISKIEKSSVLLVLRHLFVDNFKNNYETIGKFLAWSPSKPGIGMS